MERAEPDIDLKVLSWLAECRRNGFLAVRLPPEVERVLEQSSQPWTKGLGCFEFDVEYEPRSIAVSPDESRVAIGTKAGTIHQAVFSNRTWRLEEPIRLRGSGDQADTGLGRAIRGLGFIGDHWLVAGRGRGVFTIVDLEKGNSSQDFVGNEQETEYENPWLLRFTGILPLFPDSKTFSTVKEQTALALGLTPGRFLHLLERTGNDFKVRRILPEEHFGKGSQGWEENWLVDGQWSRGENPKLWLLDSAGRIHCYRHEDNPDGIKLDDGKKFFAVPYLRPRPDPRSLSTCKDGVALRFGEDVTFIPFETLKKGQTVPAPEWVSVPGAFRCLAVQEFGTTNKAYLAVATDEAGLRWIPWQWNLDKDLNGPLFPEAQPHVFEGVVGSILVTALAHGEDVPYMVQGTRHHRMRIVSLLDKQVVDHHIEEEGNDLITASSLSMLIDRALHVSQDSEAKDLEIFFLNEAPPGVALRVIQRLAEKEFQAADDSTWKTIYGSSLRTQIQKLLEKLEIIDLFTALRSLKRFWRTAFERDHSRHEHRAKIYRDFCLLIFQQAARLDEASLQNLARAAFDDIEKSLRRILSDKEWQNISSFSGLLRKWFIYGYTYGEKSLKLLKLVKWNNECGRNVDALFYLTRVLRSRVDTQWERSIQPTSVNPGLWDMVAPQDAPFLIHSHTDGRIFATDSSGDPVNWHITEEVRKIFGEGCLSIYDDEQALEHSQADDYRQFYRHGPYTRCLHLEELDDQEFLLIFGIRGWLPTDYTNDSAHKKPRLVALKIKWEPKGSKNETDKDISSDSRLTISEAAICVTNSEIYSITRIPKRSESEGGKYYLAVGTSGVWAATEHEIERLPFVEVEIQLDQVHSGKTATNTGGIYCAFHPTNIEEDARWHGFESLGEPPALLNEGSNPSWSIGALEVKDEKEVKGEKRNPHVWLWIGMHDGRVRPFFWDSISKFWIEGGKAQKGSNNDYTPPPLEPILTYSPVHKLRCLQPKAEPGKALPNPPLLAYGTANGVVGVIALSRLSKPPSQDDATQHWIHLVHSRQSTGIRGLADYFDGDQWNLAALTEEGIVILYHLGVRTARDRDGTSHLQRGQFLDQFKLSKPTRALLATSWLDTQIWIDLFGKKGGLKQKPSLPYLLVGNSDGTISCNALVVPRYSLRRSQDAQGLAIKMVQTELTPDSQNLLSDPFGRAVGSERVQSWLRLCAVGQNNLLRFSIWAELRQLHESQLEVANGTFKYISADPLILAKNYGRVLSRLADEVYGRQPFGPDGAQTLWSETARYARRVAESCVETNGEISKDRLLAYQYLVQQIDHLCNRWIGADQATEARVLIDSFGEMFNWASVVLIALNVPLLEDDLRETRKLLIFKVVQRRLRHDDILVAFKAIRTINEALFRTIEKNHQRPSDEKWTFSARSLSENPLGYYEFLTLVGELVRQQSGRLTPSDPLYTEISKFFALSILLVPQSTLIIGQVVSESWLAEHGIDVGLIQTSLHLSRLAEEIGLTGTTQQDTPLLIQRFDDYLSRKVDFEIDKIPFDGPPSHPGPEAHPWRRLIAMAWNPQAPRFTDAHYLKEQRQLLFTVARMARLSPTDKDSTPDDKLFTWLAPEAEKPIYFPDSKQYLYHLSEKRKDLTALIGPDAPDDADQKALAICDEELNRVEEWPYLVEPQKSHYRQIIQRWREEIGRRGSEARQLYAQANQLVELLDRFNRHVYRTSADDLMASLLELALRSAPLAFPMPGEDKTGLPLRLRVLERIGPFPFLTDLFQRGTLLVQRSQLAGVLLQLADTHIRSQKSRDEGTLDVLELPERNYNLKSLVMKGKEIAALEGLDWNFSPDSDDPDNPPPDIFSHPIPGDNLIWATILQELARNIYTYCRTDGKPGRLRIKWSKIGEGQNTLWCLAICGNESFYKSMETQYKDKARDNSRVLLEMVKAIESTPGTRYGPERRGSSGFGLFFLMRLAGMLKGVKAGLLLIRPEDNIDIRDGELVQPGVDDFPYLSASYLTMAFWWKRENDAK